MHTNLTQEWADVSQVWVQEEEYKKKSHVLVLGPDKGGMKHEQMKVQGEQLTKPQILRGNRLHESKLVKTDTVKIQFLSEFFCEFLHENYMIIIVRLIDQLQWPMID